MRCTPASDLDHNFVPFHRQVLRVLAYGTVRNTFTRCVKKFHPLWQMVYRKKFGYMEMLHVLKCIYALRCYYKPLRSLETLRPSLTPYDCKTHCAINSRLDVIVFSRLLIPMQMDLEYKKQIVIIIYSYDFYRLHFWNEKLPNYGTIPPK